MKKLKNWAIKKLGGMTREESSCLNGQAITYLSREERLQVVPLRAYIRTGWDCNFTEKEIKNLLVAELMRKLAVNIKVTPQKVPTTWPVRSEFDFDTVYFAQIRVVEDGEQ